MTKLLSIIVPVYNNQEGINRLLNSLENQAHSSFQIEVIVVDNNSTPKISIEKEYSFTTKNVICEKPGAYAARNTGASHSSGDILVFTDSDCNPEPDWLKQGIASLEIHEKKTVIGGEVLFYKSNTPSATEQYQTFTGFKQQENIELRHFSATANLFVYKEHFLDVGPFNAELRSCGDREWCWRAHNKGITISFSPDAIIYTEPRHKLRQAIIQTRRVAGGRIQLKQQFKDSYTPQQISPIRSPINGIKWIFNLPGISLWRKFEIFTVAAILKVTHDLESIKIKMGFTPERR